jgi:uncharacterized membrane protein YraQ (UPF0718 family)
MGFHQIMDSTATQKPSSEPPVEPARRPLSRSTILFLVLAIGALVFFLTTPFEIRELLAERLPIFAVIFLGIFIEAVPFLLLGTLSSGLVEEFVQQDALRRLIPKKALPATLAGASLGLFFPVCECGVVPLVRRLFHKGLPLPAGIAFLLAAPVLNPIVILSTAAAFGWGRVLLLRLLLTFGIAVITGLIFAFERDPHVILRAPVGSSTSLPGASQDVHDNDHDHEHGSHEAGLWGRIRRVLVIATDEFFEMGRYLVIGSALAAGMQTIVPQSLLLSIGSGPVISVLVMILLAAVLSICSTVDAFIALGFAGSFSPGSIMAFLVFGPMVDIKSTLMYTNVFRIKAVVYLILLPLLMSILAGIVINYTIP